MTKYSAERKEAVLKQLSPPHNMTLASLAQQEGISYATLYNWRNKLRQQGQPVPGNTTSPDDWSAEAKLAVVAETMPLSESELGKYCREKGLYPEQVKEWRQNCLYGFMSIAERKRVEIKQTKADKRELKQLKKQLRRKDQALSEAAALLILRKKLNAFYGEDSEDD